MPTGDDERPAERDPLTTMGMLDLMRLMSIQRQRDQERRRRQAQAPPRGKETTPHKLPLPPPSVTLWSSGGSSSSFLRLRWGKGTRWTCLRLFFLLRWVGVYLVFFTLVCVDYSNLYICSTSIYTNQKEKKNMFLLSAR